MKQVNKQLEKLLVLWFIQVASLTIFLINLGCLLENTIYHNVKITMNNMLLEIFILLILLAIFIITVILIQRIEVKNNVSSTTTKTRSKEIV